MSQRIDPDSDVSTGGFTTTPLWSKIDDGASTNDADFVTSASLGAIDDTDTFEVGLSNPASTPGSGTNTVTFRAKKTGTAACDLTVTCMEGATNRGELTQTLTTTITTYTFNPTSIGNYSNLTLLFTVIRTGAGTANTGIVYWAKMDIPDASAATTYKFFRMF